MNTRFAIELEALPSDDSRPAVIRLRAFLKTALRAFGLRCTACRETTDDQAQDSPPGLRDFYDAASTI